MATIKMCTDIPQSKKLAEILPLESADLKWFSWEKELNAPLVPTFGYDKETAEFYKDTKAIYLPCWSLAALLGVLPDHFYDETGRKKFGMDKGDYSYYVFYETQNSYIQTSASNPVDACYEIILKLNELKML